MVSIYKMPGIPCDMPIIFKRSMIYSTSITANIIHHKILFTRGSPIAQLAQFWLQGISKLSNLKERAHWTT